MLVLFGATHEKAELQQSSSSERTMRHAFDGGPPASPLEDAAAVLPSLHRQASGFLVLGLRRGGRFPVCIVGTPLGSTPTDAGNGVTELVQVN